jgi:hypothetical protein
VCAENVVVEGLDHHVHAHLGGDQRIVLFQMLVERLRIFGLADGLVGEFRSFAAAFSYRLRASSKLAHGVGMAKMGADDEAGPCAD